MIKPVTNSSLSKSKGLLVLEYILFAVCLCVIALRATLTEGPAIQSSMLGNISDNIYTLSVSSVLIFSFILWLIWSFCSGKFLYRLSGIEFGLCLFCIAAVISGFAAPNKRLAITSIITLLAPLIMTILLVQILDSHLKVKLLLCVIAALAIVSAYQSAEQLFLSNQMTIDQYEEAPQTLLEPLGIEPNTFQHFLIEHRLYSRGIRGFFTTSNSAGSFLLMASFAAIALFIEKFKNRKSDSFKPLYLYSCGVIVAVILLNLAFTASKGAIIGQLFALVLFFSYLRFGNRLKAYNKIILIGCLLLFIAGSCAIAWYGLSHGRLPGGNSMLVRWQYWQASAKMYADHPLTGVGPGNFAHFYPHYKPAEALESVADPHNFLLGILTQYGPLGLIGFLAMLLIPLWRIIPSSSIEKSPPPQAHRHLPGFRTLAIIYLFVISAALLLIRPMIIRSELGDTFEVMLYMILTLYIAPVAAFFIGFWLLTSNGKKQTRNTQYTIRNTSIITAALFCAVLGVMLHNLIDFAIFEPPVLTIFCATIAALIATQINQKQQPSIILKPAPFAKVIVLIITAAISWAYLKYCLIPVAASTTKIQQAHSDISMGFFEQACNLLADAADDDKLSPTALYLNGRLYLQNYYDTGQKQSNLLKKAELCFLGATARDSADFKSYEKLSTVYDLLGQTKEAYDWELRAVQCYPGSAEIQFELAQIAEKLNKTDAAITHYKNAIDIEDSFRRQFKTMYPNRKIVSRLDEDKHNNAKQRVELLTKESTP